MSINNIKRLLLSLVIGLCAGTVFAPREDRVAFAPQQLRRGSVVASPVTGFDLMGSQNSLKRVSAKSKPALPSTPRRSDDQLAAPSLPKAKKERMTFGNKPQQVRRGK